MKWFNLAAGSLAGGFARYLLAVRINEWSGGGFPFATMFINITGCFLIGVFNSMSEVRFLLTPETRILLMTGFCGAYTTFSTLILETGNLAKDGETAKALINFLGSGLLGYALFLVGSYVGTAI